MWEDSKVDNKYEIYTEYPYTIRNKKTHKELKGWVDKQGYASIELSQIHNQLHRVIAIQFIANSNPDYKQIDHINGIRTDNRIENLRWCNGSANNRNRNGYKGKFEFYEELPPFVRKVIEYKGTTIDDGYYIDDFYNVYYDNGERIRLLRSYGNPAERAPRVVLKINGKDKQINPQLL